ncbi:MAG: efflux RND transporter permease subunit [Parvularcula sp.]|jgi:multidrug efflux pump subunit AcrB|nr:efflux RND transporter permease subunit [Parvularcula sp.]
MRKTIRWFVDNPVAANLLVILLVAAGLFSALSLTVRLFPDIDPYAVNVTVPYPGASPEEVEQGIVEPIEEQIQGLEDVRKIDALAAENVANIIVYLDFGSDTAELTNEIRNAVSQITVFPEQAEEPQISELEQPEVIARLVLSGNRSAKDIKLLADQLRNRLLAKDNVSRVDVLGVPEYLVDIEVSSARLEALGLSLDQIAGLIRQRSLELSGGQIEGEERRLLVRTLGEAEVGEEFAKIVVLTSENGTPVLLEDVATITDDLSEAPIVTRYDGETAVALNVFRIGDEQVFALMEDVREVLKETDDFLPAGVSVDVYDDSSQAIGDRVNLLTTNAIIGFLLILGLLLLFLDVRVAFWVGVGVAISFVGTFIPMAIAGIAISQLSLFGFILAIGIVVDDAIVVGENIYATVESGETDPKQAAKRGTLRVASPVFFSVSTTVAAFLPLMFVPATVGQFIGDIAFVVVAVLILSLIESFFILPRHLSHLDDSKPGRISLRRYTDPLRDKVSRGLDRFSTNRLRPGIRFSVQRPFVTTLLALSVLIATFGLFTGGVVRQIFFPEIEGNYVTAELQLAEAASQNQTERAAQRILEAVDAAAGSIAEKTGTDKAKVVENVLFSLGQSTAGPDIGATGTAGGAAANLAIIEVKIQDAAERNFTAAQFERAWREATGRIPGAQQLTFSFDLTGGGLPVQINVLGSDEEEARAAVAALRQRVESMGGVFDISDDRFRTTEEVQVRLRPEAAAYGVDLAAVASAVRASYFGAEAVRIQRDREEIEVRVRLPKDERSTIEDIKRQKIVVGGNAIPISAVAEITVGDAPASITRLNGQRLFTLSADVDDAVTTGGEITARILGEVWDEISSDYPGVTLSPGGDQEEQARALPVLTRNFILALFLIYALLSLAFRSYTQPFIVLSVIPFGLIGALWGHALFGLDISLLSIFGIIGLSGVIINDALVMVDYMKENWQQGMSRVEGAIEAAVSRFRPIILTSLTTFFGVTPIVLEQSVQAAFLKPTAVSLGFGILVGTAVLMFVVPAMAILHGRCRDAVSWVRHDAKTDIPRNFQKLRRFVRSRRAGAGSSS